MIDVATFRLRAARAQLAMQRAITAARDKEIREAAEQGMTTRQIAEIVGLSHQRVSQIINEGRDSAS